MKKYLILLLSCLCFPARMAAQTDDKEEQFYNDWYDRITYVLENVSTRKAIDMIGEMRDYADRHDSKYGFFMVTYLSAHVARDMGMSERAEELMLQSIDYKKRNLPQMKPKIQVYYFLTHIYNDRNQGEKAIQALDNALKHSAWSSEDRIALLSLKCDAVAGIEPLDTARFMDYYGQMHDAVRDNHYKGDVNTNTECYHAEFTHDYQRLLDLAEKLTNKAERLKFKISAYDGLGRNQEAIDSFRVYKTWTDKQYNEEMRKLTEMNALELEVARAENETSTLRLHHQRLILVAIVCGLLLIAVFLSAYLYRRQLQIRQLKQAYDRLEEVTIQKERIESELRIAHDIQMKMVPNVFPTRPDIDIYASMIPAKEMCGDLYDFFVRNDQLYFCIGDVTGKGVPAALFMTVTKNLFRAYASNESTPDHIVSQMNHNLTEDNKSHMFVTLFVGILDLSSGLLRYCNAGHEDPIIVNRETRLLPINRIFPVGAVDGTPYQTQAIVMEPQTTIFLYTDGVTEAMTADKKMFGRQQILDEINRAIQARQVAPKALIERMTAAVQAFVGDTEQSDDLTMLAINYLGQRT